MNTANELQWVIVATIGGAAVNLLALAAVVWKGGNWTGRIDAERAADRESAKIAGIMVATSLHEIKTTLGNGAPGTVVRTTVCEALHAAVEREISGLRDVVVQTATENREDIRSLHEAVRKIHSGE